MDKVRALREAADAEIEKNIVGFKEELFNLRFQKKVGQIENPLKIRALRKDVARLKTEMNLRKKIKKNIPVGEA